MSSARQTDPPEDLPSPDEIAGMAWWAALSRVKRLLWLTQAAGSAAGASAASAWSAFKRADPAQRGQHDGEHENKGKR